jgi:periplasmic protein TonB
MNAMSTHGHHQWRQYEAGKRSVGITSMVVIHIAVGAAVWVGVAPGVLPSKREKPVVVEIAQTPPPPPIVEPPKPVTAPTQSAPAPFMPRPIEQPAPAPAAIAIEASETPPIEPYVVSAPAPVSSEPAPSAPIAPASAPAPATPAIRTNFSPISKNGAELEFPQRALRAGIERGSVRVHVQVAASGQVVDVRVIESNPPRVFDSEVKEKVRRWTYAAEAHGFLIEYDLTFKAE